MLQRIEINNFRSCENVRLRLGEGLVALVGKNGAGKTNLLHAIQIAAKLCVGDTESILELHPRVANKPISFALEFAVDGFRFQYGVEVSHGDRYGFVNEHLYRDDLLLFRREGEEVVVHNGGYGESIRINRWAAALPSMLQLLPEVHPGVAMIKPARDYLRSVRYHSFVPGFQEHGRAPSVILRSKYEDWKSDHERGKPADSVQLRLLDLWLTKKDGRFQELSDLLGDGGLGLISEIMVSETAMVSASEAKRSAFGQDTVFIIQFRPGQGLAGAAQRFSYSGLSSGTWRVLQMLTYLIYDRDTCMLLEQPEDSIHIGLLSRVIGILDAYASRTQLICTTHSAKVTNLVGANGVRLVTADKGSTCVSELTERERQLASEYIRDEGTLSEFLETL